MNGLFSSIIGAEGITLNTYIICTISALVCGVVVCLASAFRSKITKSFATSLVLLPAIVQTVIMMVNGNIGTGVAVMGAFSLIRFRSVPGKARDIVAIFFAMTAGISCATGYIGIAAVFTVLVCAVMIAIGFIPMKNEKLLDMRITIPESLEFHDAFDDLFAEYTKSCNLIKVKTTNMGSLYKLTYRVHLKDYSKIKEFTDKLRCRNGNLEISFAKTEEKGEEL